MFDDLCCDQLQRRRFRGHSVIQLFIRSKDFWTSIGGTDQPLQSMEWASRGFGWVSVAWKPFHERDWATGKPLQGRLCSNGKLLCGVVWGWRCSWCDPSLSTGLGNSPGLPCLTINPFPAALLQVVLRGSVDFALVSTWVSLWVRIKSRRHWQLWFQGSTTSPSPSNSLPVSPTIAILRLSLLPVRRQSFLHLHPGVIVSVRYIQNPHNFSDLFFHHPRGVSTYPCSWEPSQRVSVISSILPCSTPNSEDSRLRPLFEPFASRTCVTLLRESLSMTLQLSPS